VLLFAVIAPALLLVNLTTFPSPWFDEGLNLSTAATLARHGVYALPDSAGARLLDPAIQTGPLLIAPIALIYRDLGVSLAVARVVVVVFAFGTLAAYVLLARRLAGGPAGLLAALLLLAGNSDPFTSFVPMARQALGEVAALGLILYGLWLWLRALGRPGQHTVELVVIGAAFGLAMATKSQVLVVFPVAWSALCLADRLHYRRAGWRAFLIPGATAAGCVLGWYAAQRALAGPELFARNAAILREGFSLHIVGFAPRHVRNALGSLWRAGFVVWGLPGLLYGLWLARRRSAEGFRHASLLCFVGCWLAWFTLCSIGWSRYAFLGLAPLPIWTAALLVDAGAGRLGGLAVPPRARLALAGALALALLAGNSRLTLGGVFGPQQTDYAAFADYLRAAVPPGAVVETWEWDLDVAAPLRFHHPPTEVTNAVTEKMLSGAARPVAYDPLAANPAYLVDGPFSNWTGIYRDVIARRCVPLRTIGRYTLYRVVPAPR
jgi:hypothetical protein